MTDSKNLAKSPKKSRVTWDANNHFGLTKLAKDRMPSLPFSLMKKVVMGNKYALSLVIVGDKLSQKLNLTHRKKSYTPNVLSFPIDAHTGEILLNLKQAKREHAAREESYRYFVALLFIHSMLHLKGFAHGDTMEHEEQRLLSKFNIKNTF